MNENEFKNYYQILGIDKSLIDYVIYDNKKDGKYENKLRNEASKDKKIKEAYEICKNKLYKKYEDRIFKLEKESKLKIGMIERGIENNTDLLKKSKLIGEKESFEESVKYEVKEIKEQFNKRLAEIKEAYEALKTDGARKLYDDQLKEKELEKKNEREFLDETAYTFFEMSEREIELRADTKNNKIIKEAYNKKVEKYTKVLNDISLKPKQRKRAEDILKKAKEYYEKINTKEKRDTYKKELDLKEEIERKLQELKGRVLDPGAVELFFRAEPRLEAGDLFIKEYLRKILPDDHREWTEEEVGRFSLLMARIVDERWGPS